MTADIDANARAYLLGALSDDRAEALEQGVLADPDLLEQVQQVEDDLVDDYVGGRLSADERVGFEAHYLASAVHRDRVAVSRALAALPREAQVFRPPVREADGWGTRLAAAMGLRPQPLRWAATAAALLLVFAGWLTLRPGPAPQPAPTAPSVATVPPASTPGRPRAEPPPAAPLRVALVLSPVLTRDRSSLTPRLFVPPGTAFVDLRLDGPPASDDRVSAAIRSVDDHLAWTGTAERSSGAASPAHAWVVSLPAARLSPDDYILTLAHANAQVIARYFFRIVRDE